MKTLLPNQILALSYLKDLMRNGETLFWISGISGCGKTVAIKTFIEEFKDSGYLPIFFKGDCILQDNEYFPFFSALSDVLPESIAYGLDKAVVDLADQISTGKPFINILKMFVKKAESKSQVRDLALNEKEHDILCKIQYLVEHKDVIFVCDNLNYWDEKSVKLLYYLITNIKNKYYFLNNTIFLMIFTSNKKTNSIDLINGIKNLDNILQISFPVLKSKDFSKALSILGYNNKLSEKEQKILFTLINGHIRMLVELISELNRNKLTLKTVEGRSKEVLASILKQRLTEHGVTGEQIKVALEYASLLGVIFSSYELNQIVQMENSVFYRVIKDSREMNLIEEAYGYGNKDILQFAHDIIHDIFQQEIVENGEIYYKNIELCLREIEPNQYIRRSQYAFKSGNIKKSLILFVLELMKQLKEDGDIPASSVKKCEVLFKKNPNYDSYYEYIISMKKSYNLYERGKFQQALNEILALGEIYPKELLAEKEILCSMCYAKKIDWKYRNEGILRLKHFSSLENCNYERDIYERVLMRLLILYVHIGENDKAKYIEQQIITSLENRFNHDESAQVRFYSLNRISNSIYGCEIAANKMKKAVDYFGANSKVGGLWRNLKQYYLACVNYAGALCLNGCFMESYNTNKEILELCKQFPNYPFPRPNIFLNNYIIAGYLSHHFSVQECTCMFEELIMHLPVYADRLLYNSNYSIFLALSGNIEKAIECLTKENELQNVENDKEKLYNYRVNLNLAVYYYLLGDKKTALFLLNKLKIQENSCNIKGDFLYDINRLKNIKEYILHSDAYIVAKDWENNFLTNCNEFQSLAWNYYGKGFVFTTTFNWDL